MPTTTNAEPDELAVWRALVRVTQLLPARLEAQLAEQGWSLARYEILSALADGGALRMTELAELAIVSKPRVSVHVADLEREGLVSRSPDPDDGRGWRVSATAAGRRRLRGLAAGHMREARRLVLDHVEPRDRASVWRALRAILDALGDTAGAGAGPSR